MRGDSASAAARNRAPGRDAPRLPRRRRRARARCSASSGSTAATASRARAAATPIEKTRVARARHLVLPRLPALAPRASLHPPSGVRRPETQLPSERGAELAEMTRGRAAVATSTPGALGVGLGLALGPALIAFASGGYFPTAWTLGSARRAVGDRGAARARDCGAPVRPRRSPRSAGLPASPSGRGSRCSGATTRPRPSLEGQRVLLYVVRVRRARLLVSGARPRRSSSRRRSSRSSSPRATGSSRGSFPRAARRLRPGRRVPARGAADLLECPGRLRGDGRAACARLRDARAQTLAARVLSGATLPLLFSTVYFTFSRGAWIAGALGLAAAVAVDPRRLQLLRGQRRPRRSFGTRRSALVPPGRTDADRRAGIGRRGRRAPAGRVPAPARGGLRSRRGALLAGRPGGRAFPAGAACCSRVSLAFMAVAALLAVFVRYGGPVTLAEKGYDSFTTTSGETPRNLNQPSVHVLRQLPLRALARGVARLRGQPDPRLGPGHLRAVLERSIARSSTRFATRTASTSRSWPSSARSGSHCSSSRSARRSSPESWRAALRSSRPHLRRTRPISCMPASTGTGRWVRSRSPRSRSRRLSSRRPTFARARRSSPRGCAPAVSLPRFSSRSSLSSASSVPARSQPATGRSRRASTARRNPRHGRRAAGGGGRPTRGASAATSPRSRGTPRPRATTTGRRSRRTRATGSSGTTSRP